MIRIDGRDFERNPLIVALYFFCCLTIGVDVSVEIALKISHQGNLTFVDAVHFAIEIIALGALIVAAALSLNSYIKLRKYSDREHQISQAIKTGFDRIIDQKFDVWQLTKSEREIALLALRGMTVTEIATHRKTKEATINVHLHNVYSKAGLGSRVELLASMMDELLSSQDISDLETTANH